MPASSIEIVTHVFCPPGVRQYAQHLKWQWMSLLRYPPPVKTTYTVCYTTEEEDVNGNRYDCTAFRLWRMVRMQRRYDLARNVVKLNPLQLPPEQLFRRAIGRNMRALSTEADVIWFTDVDYMFGEGCLESVVNLLDKDSRLCMPQQILIHKNHALGSARVVREWQNDFPEIDPSEFEPKEMKVAIGGIQIIGREIANQVGYLNNTRHLEPVSRDQGFLSCDSDHKWRRSLKRWLKEKDMDPSTTRLPIPSCYRIRHEQDGRDYNWWGERGLNKQYWKAQKQEA